MLRYHKNGQKNFDTTKPKAKRRFINKNESLHVFGYTGM